MRCFVDLHIHTALSPCGDNDMTPTNIMTMSALKGLDIIAITDHNSLGNVIAVINSSKKLHDFQNYPLVVPGVELTTSEEVHLVCLFPDMHSAMKMQAVIDKNASDIKNREDIFGQQIFYDDNDNITGFESRLLTVATNLSIDDSVNTVRCLGGVVIPAHVDRNSFSIISNLGFIPEDLKFTALEVSKSCPEGYISQNNLSDYRIISSSDAHYLENISEREFFLDLPEKSVECLLAALKCFEGNN